MSHREKFLVDAKSTIKNDRPFEHGVIDRIARKSCPGNAPLFENIFERLAELERYLFFLEEKRFARLDAPINFTPIDTVHHNNDHHNDERHKPLDELDHFLLNVCHISPKYEMIIRSINGVNSIYDLIFLNKRDLVTLPPVPIRALTRCICNVQYLPLFRDEIGVENRELCGKQVDAEVVLLQ